VTSILKSIQTSVWSVFSQEIAEVKKAEAEAKLLELLAETEGMSIEDLNADANSGATNTDRQQQQQQQQQQKLQQTTVAPTGASGAEASEAAAVEPEITVVDSSKYTESGHSSL
jgi:transcription initiation factor TFIID subunit TAF12